MQSDKGQIEGGIHNGAVDTYELVNITADKHSDSSRGDGIFQQDRGTGQETSPGTHGPTGKAVATSCRGQRRRHLSQTQHQTDVHQAHHQSRDKHATETA